jgi:hypothetical protein
MYRYRTNDIARRKRSRQTVIAITIGLLDIWSSCLFAVLVLEFVGDGAGCVGMLCRVSWGTRCETVWRSGAPAFIGGRGAASSKAVGEGSSEDGSIDANGGSDGEVR